MATVWMFGGKGLANRGNVEWGGAYDPAMITWDLAQKADGMYLAGSGTNTMDSDGGDVRITDTGTFVDVVAGVYASCSFTSVYTPGRYKIKSRTEDSITLDLAYISSVSDITVVCGGALGGGALPFTVYSSLDLQIATDAMVAGDILKIAGATPTSAFIEDWDIDGASGTALLPITVEAVDTNGVRNTDTKVKLFMVSNALFEPMIDFNTVDYWQFYGLSCNGNRVAHDVIESDASEKYYRFIDCTFYDPMIATSVVDWFGDYLYMHNCEIYGATSGSSGVVNRSNGSVFESCYIHDNNNAGINLVAAGGVSLIDCRIVGNGGNGLTSTVSSAGLFVSNCTFHNNGGYGLQLAGAIIDGYVGHCIFSNNGTYGVHTTGLGPRCSAFEHNNAYGNGTDAIDVGTWATVGSGNNVALNPDYDADYFAQNMNLVKGGVADRPIGAGLYKRPAEMVAGSHFSLVGSPITGGF